MLHIQNGPVDGNTLSIPAPKEKNISLEEEEKSNEEEHNIYACVKFHTVEVFCRIGCI